MADDGEIYYSKLVEVDDPSVLEQYFTIDEPVVDKNRRVQRLIRKMIALPAIAESKRMPIGYGGYSNNHAVEIAPLSVGEEKEVQSLLQRIEQLKRQILAEGGTLAMIENADDINE